MRKGVDAQQVSVVCEESIAVFQDSVLRATNFVLANETDSEDAYKAVAPAEAHWRCVLRLRADVRMHDLSVWNFRRDPPIIHFSEPRWPSG